MRDTHASVIAARREMRELSARRSPERILSASTTHSLVSPHPPPQPPRLLLDADVGEDAVDEEARAPEKLGPAAVVGGREEIDAPGAEQLHALRLRFPRRIDRNRVPA